MFQVRGTPHDAVSVHNSMFPSRAQSEVGSKTITDNFTRVLLTIPGPPCPFGCSYCFADFTDYAAPLPLDVLRAAETPLPDKCILYPACDTDLFTRSDALDILGEVVNWGRHISVSTKARLSERTVSRLAQLSERAREHGAVLKVGVSIAGTASLAVLEPRTPRFKNRLRTLQLLNDSGIQTAVILRPLLADVPESEIVALLELSRPLADSLLLGEEYVEKARPRSLQCIPEQELQLRDQVPAWAPLQLGWAKRSMPRRYEMVRQLAESFGYSVFDSDLTLMVALINRSLST